MLDRHQEAAARKTILLLTALVFTIHTQPDLILKRKWVGGAKNRQTTSQIGLAVGGRRWRRHPAREEHGMQPTALRERPTPTPDSSRNETGPAVVAQTRSARKNLRTAALFRKKTEASTAARYRRNRAKPGRQNPSAIETGPTARFGMNTREIGGSPNPSAAQLSTNETGGGARQHGKTESAHGATRKNHNTKNPDAQPTAALREEKGLARSATKPRARGACERRRADPSAEPAEKKQRGGGAIRESPRD
jgi:hypothetical protein